MDFGDVMSFAGSSMEGDSARQKGIFGSGLLGRSAMAAKDSSSSLFFDGQQMMISFSSPNAVSSAGVCGPFTPSQWLELEHQALIYKYLDAKVPVPANLLVPIRNTILKPSIFSSYSTIRSSNSMGWPGLNSDPEPGRCRRTDGKKWRCSRDAVADQKYCERHMNRGRHRSRKPVETLSVQPEQKKNRFAMASEHAKSGAFLESSGLSSFTEMKSGNGDFFSDWPETPAYKTLEEDPQVPISIGGPLGEALNQIAAKGTSSSPTGVLPKDAAFCSISGSTAGSPPAESSSCLCDELFGSSLVNSLGFTD